MVLAALEDAAGLRHIATDTEAARDRRCQLEAGEGEIRFPFVGQGPEPSAIGRDRVRGAGHSSRSWCTHDPMPRRWSWTRTQKFSASSPACDAAV
jgi:hypothetical protein